MVSERWTNGKLSHPAHIITHQTVAAVSAAGGNSARHTLIRDLRTTASEKKECFTLMSVQTVVAVGP